MSEFEKLPMISILTPTRGRPDNIARLVDSALDTAIGTEHLPAELIEFVFYVDRDDPVSDNAIEHATLRGARTMTIVGDRIVLSEMWNACARAAKADIMLHCGDDIVFRSRGWDQLVVDEFRKYPDGIVLVHGRDGYQDERLATHGFRHRNWMNAVGNFVPPYFSSDYNDTWVTEVADKLGRRRYIPEIYTEHMHPVVNKGPLDQTHQERLARHAQDDPGRIYANLANVRQEEVRILQECIDNYVRLRDHATDFAQAGRDFTRGLADGFATGRDDSPCSECRRSSQHKMDCSRGRAVR